MIHNIIIQIICSIQSSLQLQALHLLCNLPAKWEVGDWLVDPEIAEQ